MSTGWGIFLEDYEYEKFAGWMATKHGFVIKSLIAYLITIFSIKMFLRDRKPFTLERPLSVWNAMLAGFSTLGVYYMTPPLYRVIRDHGISRKLSYPMDKWVPLDTYTHISELETGIAGYWQFLWACSKIPEFIDTLFIVLRKKPLITMHWWHHISSCYSAFVMFSAGNAFHFWCAYLNYAVHSVMYTYYCLRSMGFLCPPQVAQIITFAQIIQMMAWNAVYTHLIFLILTTNEALAYSGYALFCAIFTTNTLLLMWFKFYYSSYYKIGDNNK
jgi:hypothetical protein